jgi:hypothetical protein
VQVGSFTGKPSSTGRDWTPDGTTVPADEWGEEGAAKAPLVISAPDMGQLRLSNAGPGEALGCRFTGSRCTSHAQTSPTPSGSGCDGA